jgi:hypothetical protein
MGDEDFGITPMREAAQQMHELYVELRSAGFSRSEAMELMSRVLAQSLGVQEENESGG